MAYCMVRNGSLMYRFRALVPLRAAFISFSMCFCDFLSVVRLPEKLITGQVRVVKNGQGIKFGVVEIRHGIEVEEVDVDE